MKAEEYSVALEGVPSIASIIGVIMSCLSVVEHDLPFLLKKITGMHLDYATAALGLLRMETRLDLFSALADVTQTSEPDRGAIKILMDHLRSANATRNRYAHATYAGTSGSMIMIPYYSDTKKKTKNLIQLSEASAREDLMEIKLAVCVLEDYIHQDKMPAKFVPREQRKKATHKGPKKTVQRQR